MIEVKGKLPDRKTGYIKHENNVIEIFIEKGLLSKKRELETRFETKYITGVRIEKGIKPYESAKRIQIEYIDQGQTKEINFFSIHSEPLVDIHKQLYHELLDRNERLEEIEKQFHVLREAHLNQLSLNMELVDWLFRIIVELRDHIDWVSIVESTKQIEKIIDERQMINKIDSIYVPINELYMVVNKRLVQNIKNEITQVIEILLSDIEKLTSDDLMLFDTYYYQTLIKANLYLWEQTLSEITGIKNEETRHQSIVVFESLSILNDTEGIGLDQPSISETSLDVHSLRVYLYNVLSHLEKVEFDRHRYL